MWRSIPSLWGASPSNSSAEISPEEKIVRLMRQAITKRQEAADLKSEWDCSKKHKEGKLSALEKEQLDLDFPGNAEERNLATAILTIAIEIDSLTFLIKETFEERFSKQYILKLVIPYFKKLENMGDVNDILLVPDSDNTSITELEKRVRAGNILVIPFVEEYRFNLLRNRPDEIAANNVYVFGEDGTDKFIYAWTGEGDEVGQHEGKLADIEGAQDLFKGMPISDDAKDALDLRGLLTSELKQLIMNDSKRCKRYKVAFINTNDVFEMQKIVSNELSDLMRTAITQGTLQENQPCIGFELRFLLNKQFNNRDHGDSKENSDVDDRTRAFFPRKPSVKQQSKRVDEIIETLTEAFNEKFVSARAKHPT